MEKENFKNYLKIDKGNLNKELSKISTQVYDFGLKRIKLKEEIEKLELQLDLAEAKLSARVRNKYRNLKKPPSETQIRDTVKTNPEIVELKEKLIKLNKSRRIADLRMKTLGMKATSLENIGHNIRLEGKI